MNIREWWQRRKARHEARRLILRTLRMPRSTSERHAIILARHAVAVSEMTGKRVPDEFVAALDTLTA